MDNLPKQLRVSFSGAGEDYQNYKSRQKSASFKRGRRNSDNWFQRQFSGEMSDSDGAFETAVAVAAYAITSKEQQGSMSNGKRITTGEQRGPLTKTKSRREDSMSKPTESKISRWFTLRDTKEDAKPSGSSSTVQEPSTLGKKLLEESGAESKLPGKKMETSVTIKKTPTFSDKYLNDTGDVRDQRGQPWQRAPSAVKPAPSTSSGKGNGGRYANNFSQEEGWARTKMADVQNWYEKSLTTILEWENHKKAKARRQKERKESELELRRAKALQEYRDEMSRIDKITGKARSIAEKQRINEEAKVLEKAKKKQAKGEDQNACCSCL